MVTASILNLSDTSAPESAAPNVPTIPATDQQDLELVFIDPLPKEYECPVCKQVLRYPAQFDECVHHVCSNCLPEVVSQGSICPLDKVPINRDKVYVNKQLQKTIQALRVKCSYCERGCNWEGCLKDLLEHVSECQFAPALCAKGCGTVVERRFLDDHLSKDCGKRMINCSYCQKELRMEQMLEHMGMCLQMAIYCPHGCGTKVTRETLQEHMTLCSRNSGSVCPFGEIGCNYKGNKSSLQQHVRQEPTRHLSLLSDGVSEMKRQLQAIQLNVERLSSRSDGLWFKCENLEKLYGAQLLWKIENYTTKFNEAKAGSRTTMFSPPFMSGRHGYKMALSVCLYGDGKARGTCLSVFACICKGDYDALLGWPFSHRVTFTLLDQCQDPAARHNIVYSVKPNICKENRPFLGRPFGERNASFGAQRFCEHEMLRKLDYIRDDTIYIKVQVDTEDMTPL